MKNIIIILVFMNMLNAHACDVCGCVSGLSTQGFLPNERFHFVGIVSNYNEFQSQRNILFSDEIEYSTEAFYKSSLTGRWQISDRIAIIGSIPFVYNQQIRDNQTTTETGIGDVSIFVNTLIVNKQDDSNAQYLRVGVGSKVPTGRYSSVALETSNLFPGSGAFDILFSTNYMYRKMKWGMIQENQVRIPTENKVGYKYGTTVNANFYGFYAHKTNNTVELMPFLGAGIQWKDVDKINRIPVAQQFNGGVIATTDIGLQAVLPSWMIHLKYGHPVFQQLSNNDVKMTVGNLELGIRYLIKKAK